MVITGHVRRFALAVLLVGGCSSSAGEVDDAAVSSTGAAKTTSSSGPPSAPTDMPLGGAAVVEAVGGALNISMLGRGSIAQADTQCAADALGELGPDANEALAAIEEDPLNWSRVDDAALLPIADAYIGCVDEQQLHQFIVLNSLKMIDSECVVRAWDGRLTKDDVVASVTCNSGLEDLEHELVEELAARAVPCGEDRQWWIDDVAIRLADLSLTDDQALCVATAYVDALDVEEVLRRRLLGVPLLDVTSDDRQRLALPEQCGVDPPPLNPPLDAAPGDCLAGFGDGRAQTSIVECDQTHNGEVFAVHDVAETFDQWPGLRIHAGADTRNLCRRGGKFVR